jgi:D-alanine-D-alanine ligase
MVGRGERLKVAVLMGGPSSEHEVSLQGGRNVVEALDPRLFEVLPVVIARDGRWRLSSRGFRSGTRPFDPHREDGWKECDGPLEGLARLRALGAEVALPILHGRFGEDGVLQACLAAAGIRFVGSGSRASALANDKIRTKEVLSFHGIRTPAWRIVSPEEARRGRSTAARRLAEELGLPLVLKDPTGGSSLEVRICDDEGEVVGAIEELARGGDRLLAEAFARGRELTAGVIDDRETGLPCGLPLVEIRPRRSRTFDYREKYAPDGAEELCPAPIPADLELSGRDLGVAVHRILGLEGISRTDLILEPAGTWTVLEVNTIPGMTSTSLVPRAAAAAGIPFPELLEGLIRRAGPGADSPR